ncbi:hypothetical protein [uncultured Nostoc sp.]|uniref:hypothetical protein n=1 Tax=uncultured Nostoc sp. TaxID=340711 RepID=UPI0035CBE068
MLSRNVTQRQLLQRITQRKAFGMATLTSVGNLPSGDATHSCYRYANTSRLRRETRRRALDSPQRTGSPTDI